MAAWSLCGASNSGSRNFTRFKFAMFIVAESGRSYTLGRTVDELCEGGRILFALDLVPGACMGPPRVADPLPALPVACDADATLNLGFVLPAAARPPTLRGGSTYTNSQTAASVNFQPQRRHNRRARIRVSPALYAAALPVN